MGESVTVNEVNVSPNNKRLGQHESRPLSDYGDLCLTCEQTVFNKILHPDGKPSGEGLNASEGSHESNGSHERQHIGWLDRMAATTSCRFCGFLVSLFYRDSRTTTSDSIIDGQRFLCTVQTSGALSPTTGILLDWNVGIGFSAYDADNYALGGFPPRLHHWNQDVFLPLTVDGS
jgi:hypothetical protein